MLRSRDFRILVTEYGAFITDSSIVAFTFRDSKEITICNEFVVDEEIFQDFDSILIKFSNNKISSLKYRSNKNQLDFFLALIPIDKSRNQATLKMNGKKFREEKAIFNSVSRKMIIQRVNEKRGENLLVRSTFPSFNPFRDIS